MLAALSPPQPRWSATAPHPETIQSLEAFGCDGAPSSVSGRTIGPQTPVDSAFTLRASP